MVRGNSIGSQIEELRKEAGLTQSELAKKMNVKRETVVQWESNSRDLKTEATIRLANFFGVSCDFILRGIEAENVEINKQTGLNEEAIKTLKKIKDDPEIEIINYLMAQEEFVHFLKLFSEHKKLIAKQCEDSWTTAFKLISEADEDAERYREKIGVTLLRLQKAFYKLSDDFGNAQLKFYNDYFSNKADIILKNGDNPETR